MGNRNRSSATVDQEHTEAGALTPVTAGEIDLVEEPASALEEATVLDELAAAESDYFDEPSQPIKLDTMRFPMPGGVHIAGATRYVVTTLEGDGQAFRVDSIEIVDGAVVILCGDKLHWVPGARCESGDGAAGADEYAKGAA